MAYQSKFGQRDGLADRLEILSSRMGTQKTLPWLGLGFIADLEAAVRVLRGKPEIQKAEVEFDL